MTATRRGKPTKLGEALAGYLKSAGLADRLGQADVVNAWPALVAALLASPLAVLRSSETPDAVAALQKQPISTTYRLRVGASMVAMGAPAPVAVLTKPME